MVNLDQNGNYRRNSYNVLRMKMVCLQALNAIPPDVKVVEPIIEEDDIDK